MASPPIIVYKPRLVVEAYDPETGLLDTVDHELTDDVSVVEIDVSTDVNTIATFAGKYQVPQQPEPEAALHVIVTSGISARWAPVVGKFAQMRVYDRGDTTEFRAFDTIIPVNPALYGSTEPGEAREMDLTIPVLSDITAGTE
jgi:hypothetical protein